MTDLTIEIKFMCRKWYDWNQAANEYDDEFATDASYNPGPIPECHWDEFIEGGDQIDGKCPKCGGEVVGLRYGV